MRNQKNALLLVAVLGVFVFGLFGYQYVFAGTINWKNFQTQEKGYDFVDFKYPSKWLKCGFSDENSTAIAIVDDTTPTNTPQKVGESKDFSYNFYNPILCQNYTKTSGRYLVISDLKERTAETDIKKWIDIQNKEISDLKEKSKGGLPPTGLIPVDRVEKWKFIRYVNGMVEGQKNGGVAEVVYFNDRIPSYLVLNNGNVYSLNFLPTNGVGTLPIKLILMTLKFK